MKSVLDVLSVRVAGIVLELLGVHQSVGERVDSVEDDDTGSEERSHRLGHRGRELLSEERHCDLLCNLKLTSGCGRFRDGRTEWIRSIAAAKAAHALASKLAKRPGMEESSCRS